MELKKSDIPQVLKDYELDEDAEFVGYALYNSEENVYLKDFWDDGLVVRRNWTINPDKAFLFEDYEEVVEAQKLVRIDSEILWTFDIGFELVFASPS